MSVNKNQLFTRHGSPRKGLANALRWSGCQDIDELEHSLAEFSIDDLFRLKGNGNKDSPGLLPQYLFKIPSRKIKLTEWSNYII